MRLGVVILPEHAWRDAAALWQRAEALGFEHAWTYDHLAWRSLRDGPWHAALPTLAAAALATTRIRLGTLVASPNFRHPLPLAREVITLDDISRGRLTLGIGAGGSGWDATILGQAPWTPRERADRFDEFVRLADRLLRERELDFEGRFYSVKEARTHPGCVQQPRVPFAIAATGPRGMRLAAELGELWVTTGEPSHQGPPLPAHEGARVIAQQIARLEAACRELGREPATLRRLVLTGIGLDAGLASAEAFCETLDRYAEAGVTDLVVKWPRSAEPFAGDRAHFEACVAAALRRAESARNGAVRPASKHDSAPLRR